MVLDGAGSPIPMFPLGMVLFPGAPLPLQVFEPRYRVLLSRCIESDEPFGVVLIERGSEVGGGDHRTDVGTTAHIVEARELPNGRIAMLAVGGGRLRVSRWLDDDPHPLAVTELWPDETPTDPDALGEHTAETAALLVAALTQHQQLGDRVPTPDSVAQVLAAGLEPDGADAARVTHLLCALSPFGPLDRQRLLTAPDPVARLELLTELLGEDLDDLERRSQLGS